LLQRPRRKLHGYSNVPDGPEGLLEGAELKASTAA
jgi:hypothetical protein